MVKCVPLIAVRVEIGMPHLMAGDWAIGAMLPNPSSCVLARIVRYRCKYNIVECAQCCRDFSIAMLGVKWTESLINVD